MMMSHDDTRLLPLLLLLPPLLLSGVVAFLAGPAAAYITGQTIPVDGGYSKMGMW